MVAPVGTPTVFGDTSSSTATGTRTCGAGNFLIASVQSGDDLTQGAIPGWTYVGRQTCNDATFYQTSVWFKANCPGGDNSLTVTRASAGTLRGSICEFSGMGSGTLFMTAGFGGYGIGPAAAFPSTGTLPQAVCLIFCSFFAAGSTGDNPQAPAGYTLLDTSINPVEYLNAFQVTSDTTAQAPYWTMSPGPGPNVENANVMAVFAPALPVLYTKTVSATVTTTVGLQKLVAATRLATALTTVAIAKKVYTTITATAATSVGIGFAKILRLTVTATVATSVAVGKVVKVTVRSVVTTSASAVGIIAQGLRATVGYVRKLKARFWSNQ